MPKKIHFLEEKQEDIVKRYQGGESVKSISVRYGVSDPTIRNLLLDCNVKIRSNSEVQKLLENKGGGRSKIEVPEDIVSQILDLYENKISTTKIAEETGYGDFVVKRILGDRGLMRTSGESLQKTFSQGDEDEIVRMYRGGCSSGEIGKSFGVGNRTIIRLLRARGVEIRQIGQTTKKLDQDQELDVVAKYLDGFSTTVLATEYSVSAPTIARILKNYNIHRPTTAKKLNYDEKLEIAKKYLEGCAKEILATQYGVSYSTIKRILKDFNVQRPESTFERSGKVKLDVIEEMKKMYELDFNLTEIGRKYGVNASTVRMHLIGKGVSLRSLSEARGGLSKEEEKEAIKRYLSGQNSVDIGKSLGRSYQTILATLRRNGIQTRTVGEAICVKNEMHLDVEDICRRYQEGETAHCIANSLSIGYAGIYALLRRNNIQIRTKQEAQIHRFEQHLDVEDICSRYIGGESANAIAEDYPISGDGILNLLKRHGVEVRERPAGGDSIRFVLDGTGRFIAPRETWYYIYVINGYDGLFKPGISHDHVKRAKLSRGRYGECVFEVLFGTREECYLIEQAILKATIDFGEYPEELVMEDWDGINELRRIPLEDLVAIFEFYASELEDLGIWKFASAYVPMTEGERRECLQRSETEG